LTRSAVDQAQEKESFMCETPNRPQSPLSRAVAARWLGCADSHLSGYREPFEELWWTAAPGVWRALNSSAGARIPEVSDLRLRSWIATVTSENPVAALALAVLDQAYRDFTILRSSCSTYSVVPADVAKTAVRHRYKKTERGHGLAVRNAQDCVARIACALHGANGRKVIRAAVEHERALDQRIFEMIKAIR
jgi:hypothetical protein